MDIDIRKVRFSQDSSRWRIYSLGLIILFIFLSALRWQLSPIFIDIYYHLSTVLGFNEAGGFVRTAFWEFAPVGRPHLYPPLLHILMLIVYKMGLPILSVGRLFEFIIYPALIISIWWFIKSLFNERLAFFAALVSLSIYSFFLSTVSLLAASLALILGMVSFVCLERQKVLISAILLGLSFYAHSGIPIFLVISFVIYGILNKEKLKVSIYSVLFGLVLAAPFLIYQFSFIKYIDLTQTLEKFPLEINLWLLIAIIPGVIISLRRKGRYYFFLSLTLAGLLLFISGYKYRYMSGQGILGFIFLSALTLEVISNKVLNIFENKSNNLVYYYSFLAIILIFFLVFSPALIIKNQNYQFYLLNSTYLNIFPYMQNPDRPHAFSVYCAKCWKDTIDIIKSNTLDEDIIYCNQDYPGGMLSVFSNRATSTAMLKEVKPYERFDPIKVAKLVIWLKDPDRDFLPELHSIVRRYNLEKVAETDMVYIYRNPHPQGKKIIRKAVLPNALMFSILGFMTLLIILGIKRK